MCINCGCPSYVPCSCVQSVYYNPTPCSPVPCSTTYTWDFASIIYNKSGNTTNAITGLNLPNGTTLKAIIETIDTYIKQIKVADFALPYLRTFATVNSVQQFAEVVDSFLADTGYLGEVNVDPVTIANGQYWFRIDTDELKIKLNGTTRVITIT